MDINRKDTDRWKEDFLASVDYYNDWFMDFAPKAYRDQREEQADVVEETMAATDNLKSISPAFLKENPFSVQMLRQATSPPIARDRLIGLAYVRSYLIESMEGAKKYEPRIPPTYDESEVNEELSRVCEVIEELIDRDICPWLKEGKEPTKQEKRRAATVFADRLCGMAADPIIRNAQEQEQKKAIREWLLAREYKEVDSSSIGDVRKMEPGTFTFGCNAMPPGSSKTNLPMDSIIQPHRASLDDVPIFIEMKSAGDETNTNKRRKEESDKMKHLKEEFGEDVIFVLFLRGYFNMGYLGYEAAEGIDWVWEHRIEDMALLDLDKPDGSGNGTGRGGVGPDGEGDNPTDVGPIESKRLDLQEKLDSEKSQDERNQLGQFATPTLLASEITQEADRIGVEEPIDFLDPAFGTGAFLSAVRSVFGSDRINKCKAFEVDEHYAQPTKKLWEGANLNLEVSDFTAVEPPEDDSDKYNLLIANPPYIRHHHIKAKDKRRLKEETAQIMGYEPSGLSGMYAYFIYLAHRWLRQGGLSIWLIPSEFMYVNYGRQLRDYLTTKVSLVRVHRFDPKEVQFTDALVSSAVVIFRNDPPSESEKPLFTYGGSLNSFKLSRSVPLSELRQLPKWNRLYRKPPKRSNPNAVAVKVGDLFSTKRGLATGANKFFIMTPGEARDRKIPRKFLQPILPSPRYISDDRVESQNGSMPDIEKQQLLLSCDLPEEELKEDHPAVWDYLQVGKEKGIHERYLCSRRTPWYSQEQRNPAPIVVSYMGRSSSGRKPFRFILNRTEAVVANTYLNLYPTEALKAEMSKNPDFIVSVWKALKRIGGDDLIANGRTYGGGLHKMEPSELKDAVIPVESGSVTMAFAQKQTDLFD